MMKKILFTLTILLFAAGSAMAQEITNTELKKFVAEFRAPGCGPRNETITVVFVAGLSYESFMEFNDLGIDFY